MAYSLWHIAEMSEVPPAQFVWAQPKRTAFSLRITLTSFSFEYFMWISPQFLIMLTKYNKNISKTLNKVRKVHLKMFSHTEK